MTDYQINLVVNSYFNKILDLKIPEDKVIEKEKKKGELYIVLENGKIIKEKIKNYYN